jgi:hypothetical protein
MKLWLIFNAKYLIRKVDTREGLIKLRELCVWIVQMLKSNSFEVSRGHLRPGFGNEAAKLSVLIFVLPLVRQLAICVFIEVAIGTLGFRKFKKLSRKILSGTYIRVLNTRNEKQKVVSSSNRRNTSSWTSLIDKVPCQVHRFLVRERNEKCK